MTKLDYLNAASDLRRIAYWTATGVNKKLAHVLLDNIQKEPGFRKFIQINTSLPDKLIAEELLMASRQLQAIESKTVS